MDFIIALSNVSLHIVLYRLRYTDCFVLSDIDKNFEITEFKNVLNEICMVLRRT